MEKDNYILLIYKQLDNDISETELKHLNSWLSESQENQALADDLAKAYDASDDYMETEAALIDVDAAFAEQLELIKDETPENVVSIDKNKPKRSRIFSIVTIAAAVLALVVLGVQYLEYRTQAEAIVSTEIESQTVTFIDGSTAILAPNSTIKYNNYFNENGRSVELIEGKATFSVVKEKGTFRVKTGREIVTVLGTIFDVQFGESQSEISVKEGKVNVRQNATKKGQIEVKSIKLVAGESVISSENSLVKTKIENDEKVNYFEFQETNLKTIATNLESYFDTSILVNSKMENCPLTVTFDGQELEDILVILDKLLNSEHREIDGGFEIIGEGCESFF